SRRRHTRFKCDWSSDVCSSDLDLPMSFTQLLGQHFVHTALLAGAIVSVLCGTIGVFVVIRGLSFAVHAVSELAFTGAAGALVLAIGRASCRGGVDVSASAGAVE